VPPTDEQLHEAAAHLRAGRLVGMPTETVYGLAADATNADAVRRVFAVKGRPADHPLIVHLGDAGDLLRWSRAADDAALRLAAAFWPGPLTIVLPAGEGLAPECRGGHATIGLRVPDHPVALRLLALVQRPLAAPSANRFGRVSPTCAEDVRAELGDAVAVVLDGGPCRVGVESTIIELVGRPTLLRPGGVPVELIEEVLGEPVERSAVGPSRASGMLASHYAPATAVRLVEMDELAAAVDEQRAAGRRVAVLAAPPGAEATHGDVIVLRPPADVADYARTLYRRLREADEAGADVLLVVPPPPEGLGLAVLDRLRKSAAPRP
jgi:L-threonylcarbamoyladenylate synthase